MSADFIAILQKFTLELNGKYYLRQLDSALETSVRNILLELVSQGKKNQSRKV